jgi:pyruvate dehydrogenase E1 component
VLAAAEMLEKDYGVPADVFSVTSFNELRRDALDAERWNLLNPAKPPRTSYLRECLGDRKGPFIAATDYMKTVPDQVRQWIPGRYAVLGTDGYGRSDSRAALRQFFEVDRHYITVAALKSLSDEGKMDAATVTGAMKAFGIDPKKPNPLTV